MVRLHLTGAPNKGNEENDFHHFTDRLQAYLHCIIPLSKNRIALSTIKSETAKLIDSKLHQWVEFETYIT